MAAENQSSGLGQCRDAIDKVFKAHRTGSFTLSSPPCPIIMSVCVPRRVDVWAVDPGAAALKVKPANHGFPGSLEVHCW